MSSQKHSNVYPKSHFIGLKKFLEATVMSIEDWNSLYISVIYLVFLLTKIISVIYDKFEKLKSMNYNYKF